MLDAGTLTGVSLKCEDPHKTRIATDGQTGARVERAESAADCPCLCVIMSIIIVTS